MKRQTSRIAYQKKMSDGTILTDKEAVLRAMRKLKYATREDVAKFLKWDQPRTWRRLSDLVKDGKIEATEVKKVASANHLQAYYKMPGVKEIRIAV